MEAVNQLDINMNRKEFLLTLWAKGIKPVLTVIVIFFCGKFLYNVFDEDGTERAFVIATIELGLLILTLYLVGQLFKSLKEKINSLLPESIKFWLKVANKTLNYISPIILGAVIYHFWKDDWFVAAFVMGVLLIEKISDIIKEERHSKADTKVQ